MNRRIWGELVAVGLCLITIAPTATAEDTGRAADQAAWDRIDAVIDADLAAGKSFADKADPSTRNGSTQETPTGMSLPASSSSGGEGSGTGTTVGDIGTYPTRPGVILVTPDWAGGVIPTGHAGIVYTPTIAIESIGDGVQRLPNKWYRNKKQAYGVVVRTTSVTQDKAAAIWAYRQINKPYNIKFYDVRTRDRFYCAQLVWAAFKDTANIDLNTAAYGAAIHPMEFVGNPKTMIVYRMRP